MPNQKPIFLPLDLTGSSSLNLVENEKHALSSVAIKLIKPQYSPFYKKDLVVTVTDADNSSITLSSGTDYQYVDIVSGITKETGLEVYRFILIARQNISGTVGITYRALGGQQNGSVVQTLENANAALATDVQVLWSEVHDKPNGFTPKPHSQDAEDLYGMEYLRDAIARIKADILNTTNSRKLGLNAAIQALIKEWILIRITPPGELNAHLENVSNTHTLTKAQIGLEDVQNTVLCTPAALKKLLSSDEKGSQLGHLSDYNNPHSLTKAQLGLDNVSDYGVTAIDNTTSDYIAEGYVVVATLAAAVQNLLAPYIKKSNLGVAGGVAKLSSSGTTPTALIPVELGYTCADVYDYFVAKPTANQVVFSVTTLRNPHCVVLFKRSVLTCSIAPTAACIFTVLKNGTKIGQFTFSAGGAQGVYTSVTGTYMEKLLPGDLLQVRAPATADTTLAGIGLGLMAGVPA